MRDGPLRVCGGGFFVAKGAQAEGTAAEIHGNAREACAGEPGKGGTGRNRGEGAADVDKAMHPTVVNFKGKKDAARTKHAVNLRKHAVLQFARAQMMQDENSDGGGKALGGERELRGITAKCAAGSTIVLRLQSPGGFGVVFKRSNTSDGFAELRRGRAVASANFEDVIPKGRTGQDPGKQLPLGEIAPERRGTQEMLKTVHGLWRGESTL
jgi:hypothetical protein